MRLLIYTFLLFLPLAGFTQTAGALNGANTSTEKGYIPPPQVMVAPNDQCSGVTGSSALSPTLQTYAANTPALGFSTQTTTNDPYQIIWPTTGKTTWVSYTVPTGTTVGTLSVTLSTATAQGLQVAIFSGGCAAFTGTNSATATALQSVISTASSGSLAASTGPATATATCLVPGVTYYIMVGATTAATLYTVTTTYSAASPATSPVNNCCSNAIDISSSLNGSTVITGTTSGATSDAPYVGGCNSSHNNVWYSFVAQGPNLEVTATGTASPEFVVLASSTGTATDVCTANSTSVLCASATSNTATANNVTGTALVTGQTYYISVTNTITTGSGTFNLTVNNPPPNPAGTNCSTAALLCTTTPNVFTGGNTNLWGTEELSSSTIADCNSVNGEVHSAWYVINVVTGGSLTFTITPTSGSDNYDFSLYNNNPATCSLTAPVSCNTSTVTGSTGISPSGVSSSQGTSGTAFNQQLTVNAGDVYILMVNSPKVAGTYNITLGTDGTPAPATYTNCSTFPVILPVSLIDFTAIQNESEIDLKWSTASEINNNYFTVERSSDSKHFEEIAQVKGAGTGTEELNYSVIDYTPLPGVSYYRLSQTDFNGKTEKLKVISVRNKENDGLFTIAPNPTDGSININYTCETGTAGVLKLYDNNAVLLLSQTVICNAGDNKAQLDLNEIPSGIYFITFTTNISFYRTKLIKR
jgi:hypothetical protein